MPCRPPYEGEAPSTRFRHTMVPINPSPRTPLYEMVSEALGTKDTIHAGQLLLIFGGYNTIGEEFGANSTFVSPRLTTLVQSCCHGHALLLGASVVAMCEMVCLFRCCGQPLTAPATSGGRSRHRERLQPLDFTTAATALMVSSDSFLKIPRLT